MFVMFKYMKDDIQSLIEKGTGFKTDKTLLKNSQIKLY